MQILVNTRMLIDGKLDGIGWFAHETLMRMTRENPDVHFVFAFDRPFHEKFIYSDNITPVILTPQARHPILFWYWFDVALGSLARDLKPDLLLSPDGYLPLWGKTTMLPVIHDINFHHYPQNLPWLVRKYYNFFFPRFARKAKRIATVSEFSKNDISGAYGIETRKIDVVYNGVNPAFKPLSGDEQKVVRRMVSQGKPYFLFTGTILPRKNLGTLLKAFELFRSQTDSNVKLIIAGAKYWWRSEEQGVLDSMKFKDEVIFTGRIPQHELERLTASALAITYIPLFEGFGIPILEGMASGVPVITSRTSSMPEVSAGATLLVNPENQVEVSNAMKLIFNDERLRNDLITKGNKRVKDFHWDNTAALLWKSVEKSVNDIS